MKAEIEKLTFEEVEKGFYVAESSIGDYYINYDEIDGDYKSYTENENIGYDEKLIEAIHRITKFHNERVLDCLVCQG